MDKINVVSEHFALNLSMLDMNGMRALATSFLISWTLLSCQMVSVSAADVTGSKGLQFFENKIRPVLADKCYRCHSADAKKLKAGLMLDHRSRILKGGDSGASIQPGNPDKSLLIETIVYDNADLQMPPKSKLDDSVIANFKKWVAMGAPWPEEETPLRSEGSAVIEVEGFDIEKRRASHWSWQPIKSPPIPAVKNATWSDGAIDRFILAGLDKESLLPAGEAAPSTWLRRVYFDLIGLPPTPEEIEIFLADKKEHADSTEAEQGVVDQLLASQHFGERWARHWMDNARYAETAGHEFDYPIADVWRYRDYLIRAFNEDLPYDQFLTEHLAGDLVKKPRRHPETQTNESILATSFWFLNETVHAPTDVLADESDRMDNQLDVFGKTFMGLTIGCARCHDHKFDAISTADYYALCGMMQSSRRQSAFLDPYGKITEAAEVARKLYRKVDQPLVRAFEQEKNSNKDAAQLLTKYLIAAQEVADQPSTAKAGQIFEDFESKQYHKRWKAEGRAFGKGPTIGKVKGQQAVSGFNGKGLVNSFLKTDKLTGSLRSEEFIIRQPYIHFFIGGGAHRGKTCINLKIGGDNVLSATGKNNEKLDPHVWDVRAYIGKSAQLEIVDQAKGSWGHINVDHIVFSDQEDDSSSSERINPEILKSVAAKHRLNESLLKNWVVQIRQSSAGGEKHPLFVWSNAVSDPSRNGASFRASIEEQAQAFKDFRQQATSLMSGRNGIGADQWTRTGESFDDQVTQKISWTGVLSEQGLLVPAGVFQGGRYGKKMEGVLRSPTFKLTKDRIHLRLNGRNIKVRLVIDGFYMNHFHQLLFRGTVLKPDQIDTQGEYQWFTMKGNLDKYIGHRVWLEISDLGDGFVSVGDVLMSKNDLPKTAGMVTSLLLQEDELSDRSSVARAYGKLWSESLLHLKEGKSSHAELELINFIWRHQLWPQEGEVAVGLIQVLAQLQDLDAKMPKPLYATALLEGTPENDHVHIRGSHKRLGEKVERRNLTAFDGTPFPANSSGRMQLAKQLTSPDNPLVTRVIVNRLWHQLFGRGLVPTVDDFGNMGQRPSHPDLLDWLAADFTSSGWSIKKALRQMTLSKTYRMSSAAHPGNSPDRLAEIDPQNVLLHRATVRRLQGEAIRDAMLVVSRTLDPAIGGKSIPVHLTSFMDGRGRPRESGPLDGANRRSLYVQIRRNFLPPFMLTFDMPAPFNSMGRRSNSNVPAQALALMNDPFVLEEAKRWADNLHSDASKTEMQKIDQMFLQAFGRRPKQKEADQALAFLELESGDPAQAWKDLCHVLFNKKEFIYLN